MRVTLICRVFWTTATWRKQTEKYEMSPNALTPESKLLKFAEIAAILGVGARTLRRWISSGVFPRADVAVGKCQRWLLATVENWIAKGGKPDA
jgi:predicted DNA-binding transcriptional regulator AlpA